jgi:CubicO group peptidase (beta-lactamase class C family)
MKIAFGLLVFLSCLPRITLSQNSITLSQDSITLSRDTLLRKLDDYLTQTTKLYQFNGSVLIAKGDSTLLAKGYGWRDVQKDLKNSPQTIFQLGSLTKPFTSEIILMLNEKGRLSLHDKLSKFLPDYPNADKITIENLLDHTSGIYNYDVAETDTIAWTSVSRDTILSTFMHHPLEFKPGSQYRYSNSGYFLLGIVIEKITGMPYEQAVREWILKPLHMYRSGFDFIHLLDPDKATGYAVFDSTTQRPVHLIDSTVPYAAGAMYSDVIDLFAWARSVARRELLSPKTWNRAQTPVKSNYGYGWISDKVNGKNFVGHGGGIMGFRSLLCYFPADDITVILLDNSFNENDVSPLPIEDLTAIIFDKPYQLPTAAGKWKISDSLLKQYSGTYYLSVVPKRRMVIQRQDGHLVALVSGQTLEIVFQTDNQFQFRNVPNATGQFIFTGGAVSKISVTQNGHYEWIRIPWSH